jgi:uncharacterized protein YjbJ (UPF0337 family)
MNKDTVKGTVDDAAGRAERQVGEWTGDVNAQVEGGIRQVKGKVEKTVGHVKDTLRDKSTNEELERERRENERKHHEAVGS